jgi:UDP-2,3-diacylglucosamine pyrophosphatase LpxH
MGGQRHGDENFQVFNRGLRLARFIRYIAAQRPDEDIALVLNGDVFDSLAEDDGGYIALDAERALSMMDRLYNDPSFEPVWEALATFIRTPKRHLALVVGNHDIELALPVVEHSIRQRLADGNLEVSGRITFSAHGAGFACRVGNARVFCTHGNEVDPWNWIDYSALGQLANAINGGRRVNAGRWKPNAGTRLVIDVMNHVKRRMPFVDLLKPEKAAVAGVLMALDRELVSRVDWTSVWPVLRDRREGRQVTSNILGAYAADMHASAAPVSAGEISQSLLGPNMRELALSRHASEEELLLEAERALTRGVLAGRTTYEIGGTLSVWDLVAGGLGVVPKPEALRRALMDWLAADRTFDIYDPADELYVAMKHRVADSVDFLVTGHTHQPRAMTYEHGCHYYNAGTWIRSLQLTKEVLANPAVFEGRLWPVLRAGRMDALDAAQIPGPAGDVPLVLDRTNAVRIVAGASGVVGDLLRVRDDGADRVAVLPEQGTTPFKAR